MITDTDTIYVDIDDEEDFPIDRDNERIIKKDDILCFNYIKNNKNEKTYWRVLYIYIVKNIFFDKKLEKDKITSSNYYVIMKKLKLEDEGVEKFKSILKEIKK